MASLIEDYNYDIFISYRQKDNKYDGWVTEFVDHLKKELEATFKEEVSVYFDINPSDYLLESYDVDASLKDKLKCLVFIPILSRTYCDSKSFAWVHEFRAFVEMASKDQYGLKIKLPNGNVASRVLPVRIHDLDSADIKECESALGGVLRGIEFIYKEAGIDKPLAPDDNEKKNLNNTKYRIQLIKVAHSIKEIILGIKNEPAQVVSEKDRPKESVKEIKAEEQEMALKEQGRVSIIKFLIPLAILALLIVAGIISYPKIFKRDTLEKLRSSGERISVAVMPFQNMTNDTTKNFWQDLVQDNLIIALSNSEELKVRQTESIRSLLQDKNITNYASLTPAIASNVSQKLDARVFIHGSINQVGSIIRLNAKLVDSKTEEIIKSFQKDGTSESILPVIDTLSAMVRDFLIISKLKQRKQQVYELSTSTDSPEAYRYYINGKETYFKFDYPAARNLLLRAFSIDSNLTYAAFLISCTYRNQGMYDEAKKWGLKLYKKRDQMSLLEETDVNRLYADLFETPYEGIKYTKQLLEIDDQNPRFYYNLACFYGNLDQYENAISAYEKALDIYKKWDSRPLWVFNYDQLGTAYHVTGQYKKEKKLYKKAEKDFPDNPVILDNQAVLAFTEGDTVAANLYIERLVSIRMENSWSEAGIKINLAYIYSEADLLDKAEKYYRQALSLEPKNANRFRILADFLIDKERNINEGLELAEKYLELTPVNYLFLDTKGWGLFKLGKYEEALGILQESWNLRLEKATYDHQAWLHLEAAKKAVAGMK